MPIPVIWYEGIAGLYAHEGVHGRSRYACCGLLNDMFDSYNCEHYSGWTIPENTEGAIVVIHGGHLRNDVININRNIARLKWCLAIGMGDEEADFKYQELRHPNMKIWQQSPIPGVSRADRFLIVGYPCDIHEHLIIDSTKPLDWFFAGQITHDRRRECVAALRNVPNGKLLETQQFYSGMEHAEYFRIMGQAKIIPCPSGPVNSDTFRMAEALEAGCIPICDQHPGWRAEPTRGIFNMLFPQGVPFPIIGNWNEAPQVIERILADYENQARIVQNWWAEYKRNYFSWLGQDLKALGVAL